MQQRPEPTAVDLLGFPSFGALANRSLRSPFGWNSCAQGRHGWYAQSREWDRVLPKPPPDAGVDPKATTRRTLQVRDAATWQ